MSEPRLVLPGQLIQFFRHKLLELPPRPCQQRSVGILSVWPWSVPEFLQELSDAASVPSIGTVRQCIQMFAFHWTLQSRMRLAGRGGVPSTAINTEFMFVYVTSITNSYGALFQNLVPTHSSGCGSSAAS